MRIAVRLTPRGGRDAVDGWGLDGSGRAFLRVRVAAPPVDGQANDALVALLAKALGCPRSAVRLVTGAGGRIKRIEIDGVSQADLDSAFGLPSSRDA